MQDKDILSTLSTNDAIDYLNETYADSWLSSIDAHDLECV